MRELMAQAEGPGPPSRLTRVLLTATVAELVLLGGGRLLQVGPLTARMVLFALGIVVAALHALQRRRIDGEVATLVLAFLVVLLWGVELGLLSGAPLRQIAEDVKPLMFFLGVLFFTTSIKSTADVRRVAAAIRWGAVVLALAYLGLLVAVFAGVIPFGAIYRTLMASGEVFFRGDTGFFYKGFLYLGVGIFFFAFGRGARGKLAAGLLLVALVLTFTRGLLLATSVVLAVAFVLRQRNAVTAAAYIGGMLIVVAAAFPFAAAAFANRAQADAVRLNDVREVLQGLTSWSSVLVGHGLGVPIGSRDRIEATYLEILFQQGLVGLALWGLLFLLLARDYLRARRAGHAGLAEPFFLGALFVFLESATNPFLTNPIGMTMVLLALVSLRVLAREPGPEPASLETPVP